VVGREVFKRLQKPTLNRKENRSMNLLGRNNVKLKAR
jgi:hypothetical protein